MAKLALTREQVLSFRRRVSALDYRLARNATSIRQAAWAGLQDSAPRAAVLSLNARVEGTDPAALEDPSLVQIWGPRFNVYVVAADDLAVFTLGRFPLDPTHQQRARNLASRLDALLDGGMMPFGQAARALATHHPNELRYAAVTGSVLVRWDGALQPTVRTVPAPEIDPSDARRELARRYLHVFGPSSVKAFADWAGVRTPSAVAAFDLLEGSLTAVTTPIGAAWMLDSDEESIRAHPEPGASVRLLPSGDTYYLLQGDDRELLVPDADNRRALWTTRVWPGAVLANGEIVGTWRRAKNKVTISTWSKLARKVRDQVAAEAAALPLPDADGTGTVVWAQ